MTPHVSVVVNTNGRTTSLGATLASLEMLEYSPIEVIVVAGPDRDGLTEALAPFGHALKTVLCDQRNLSASRNLGIRAASGRLIAFLDDDAVADPGWLTPLVAAFDDREVAAAGGPVFDHTGGAFQARYSVVSRAGVASTFTTGPNPSDLLSAPESWSIPYPIGTNACFRRDLLVAIGGFDEQYDYYLDEADVCMRLVERGWKVQLLDTGYVYHKFLPSSVRDHGRVVKDWSSILTNVGYFAARFALPRASRMDVAGQLGNFISLQRSAISSWIALGLANDDDRDGFERAAATLPDCGWNLAIENPPRTRPSEWFENDGQPRMFPRRLMEKPLHLCFVSEEYLPARLNGIARVVHTLASGLAQRGHIVRVITRGGDWLQVDRDETGVWVHRVPVDPVAGDSPAARCRAFSTAALVEARRIEEMRHVDVVQVPNWNAEGLGVIESGEFTTSLGLYTPLLALVEVDRRFRADDPDLNELVAMERRCYEGASAVLACGAEIVRDVERRYDVAFAPAKVSLVRHGLPDRSPQAPQLASPVVSRGVEILFVGRLEPRKGVDVFLAASRLVSARHPDVHFTVVGDASQTVDGMTYPQRFEEEGPLSAVTFLGEVSDAELDDLYSRCSLFAAPSRFESFGLILVEAMMRAKPVIGSDVGGIREIVEDGGNGFLVPPGDADALADAMERLIESPALRMRFGARSRELYDREYRVDVMLERAERHYADLVGLPGDERRPWRPERRPDAPQAVLTRGESGQWSDWRSPHRLRCPTCAGNVRAITFVQTDSGSIKEGLIACDACGAIAAEVTDFQYNFHAAGRSLPSALPEPRTVRDLGERRLSPAAPDITLDGAWRQDAAYWSCDGGSGATMTVDAEFTDAVVRLLKHPAAGMVDLVLDGVLVVQVDLYQEEGSLVIPVRVAADLPLGRRQLEVRPATVRNENSDGRQVHVQEFVLRGPEGPAFPAEQPLNYGNPYSPVLQRWFDAVPSGEPVLECGGGDRRTGHPNYVNFEYMGWELANVLGDIHSLPFADNVFTAALSQAVFEHVERPFVAASELMRVVKPGGLIVTEVAFMQPLHAVPHHFFNMTLEGVEALFPGCTVLDSGWFGELSTTVDWMLRTTGVSDKVPPGRLQRLSAELRDLDRYISHDDLKPVASGVYLVVRTAIDSPGEPS